MAIPRPPPSPRPPPAPSPAPEKAARSLGAARRSAPRPADPRPVDTPLRVSVVHGDLAYARHPVLVGHYLGDAIVSAEAALDRRMRGADPHGPLSRQRELGLYPGAVGSHAVFFNERRARSPAGAIVLGLGPFGDLSPGRLEACARDGMLDYAMRLLQRQASGGDLPPGSTDGQAGRISARVSALLVGSGAGSLRVRESLEALLRGALAANRRLSECKLAHRVAVVELEFIELYADLALTAAAELDTLLGMSDLAKPVDWAPRQVVAGEGRRQRSRFNSDPSWWRRVEIVEDRVAGQLRFIVSSDRARADETLAAGQLRLADAFIARACGQAENRPNEARSLFEMLLPLRLKESAPEHLDTVLLLDEASARFPWELLQDGGGRQGDGDNRADRPQAVAAGLVRQLKSMASGPQPPQALGNTALVIGNPDLAGWPGVAELPGAEREAKTVLQALTDGGFVCGKAIGTGAEDILDALHRQGWRVLHLAGHGVHEAEVVDEPADDAGSPADATSAASASDTGANLTLPDGRRARLLPQRQKVSGMVIGRNTVLTAGDVAQMRQVPELVFINCCHLGQTGGASARYNQLAANLGVAFIRMGVRAVVCAGWAVQDQAAATFAKAFYRAMLDGQHFGEAVRLARLDTWERHRDSNTWGAYQCYGDPDYRLLRESTVQRRSQAPPPFYAPSELVAQLRNLVEATRMQVKDAETDPAALQKDLVDGVERLLKRIPQGPDQQPLPWKARADVCAELGFAYGEALLFDDAVRALEAALAADIGDCPIRAAEQCAHFRYRRAGRRWLATEPRTGPAADAVRQQAELEIDQALAELAAINQRAATKERLSLLGGACKRLALVQQGPQRTLTLGRMGDYYRQAYDKAGDAYAFVNWMLPCVLLQRASGSADAAAALAQAMAGRPIDQLAPLIDQQLAATRQELQRSPSLWLATGAGDLMLLQLLTAADDAAAQRATLATQAIAQYGSAFARGASLREQASVREHLDFLRAIVADQADVWRPDVAEALARLRQQV